MINAVTCGNGNPFTWKITDKNVIINRPKMKNKDEFVSLEIFERVNINAKYKGSITLSNNVEKMNNGTEKDGIGTFLINQCSFKSSDAQIASQIAAILCQVGAWTNNGKQKNIEFYSKTDDCINKILDYYTKNNR